MTVEQFIEKATTGGWNHSAYIFDAIFLDPEAWKAVGKVEGWQMCMPYMVLAASGLPSNFTPTTMPEWRFNMLYMADALADGKSIEEYLATL